MQEIQLHESHIPSLNINMRVRTCYSDTVTATKGDLDLWKVSANAGDTFHKGECLTML